MSQLDRLTNGRGGRLARTAVAATMLTSGLVLLLVPRPAGASDSGALALTRDVPPGHVVVDGDLRVVPVAGEGVDLVPESRLRALSDGGWRVTTGLPAGALLTEEMVASRAEERPVCARVGVSLAPGRLPVEGAERGEVVRLVDTGSDGAAATLVSEAMVQSARQVKSVTVMTVLVRVEPTSDRTVRAVAAASAEQRLNAIALYDIEPEAAMRACGGRS